MLNVNNTRRIRVKYPSGAITHEIPSCGARAVVHNGATVVDVGGIPIPPKTIVICRRVSGEPISEWRPQTGMVMQAIDPGPRHDCFVLPLSTVAVPNVSKTLCRGVGECAEFSTECVGCCNHHPPEKKKKK